MYLKSIEMHGFKSFAGRIVLSFNDGITGIVGPNGSGKSNVSDAVRWVLGEQSAKSLRGSNMQDVIFSGTESRKALSFAYVCLTLDNSDHALPLDFDEVSISRRIYRSGESEYQINKANCRLKDIQELFYDTGIGKEGYSIIGQGQIERILSSKPEDRREIFDEAVGIVKYKKRKEASLKRLQEEEDNLTRIEDVLSELTDRVEPLRAQAKKAEEYLSVKDRKKHLDINLFISNTKTWEEKEEELKGNKENLTEEIARFNKENEELKDRFDAFTGELKALDEKLSVLRENERKSSDEKGEMGARIKVLSEKINSGKALFETLSERQNTITEEESKLKEELDKYDKKFASEKKDFSEIEEKVKQAREYAENIALNIKNLSKESEDLNKELLALKDKRTEITLESQKYDNRLEQINIQKASLNKKALDEGTKEERLNKELSEVKEEFIKISDEYEKIQREEESLTEKSEEFDNKISALRLETEELKRKLATLRAKRETIKTMAERYEGYGGAVRHIMEQKDSFLGVIGVVADLISSDKKYEVAIETALGGALKNIVTEDEAAAKECIDFLKRNKHGRVTFLPVTTVSPKDDFPKPDALNEKGAIDIASKLAKCDMKFYQICEYLLGRILIVDTLDNALAIAKKYNHGLNIVTLEGEQVRPGGSITGGSFKNNSNLLGRKRELSALLDEIKETEDIIDDKELKLEEYLRAVSLVKEDLINNSKEKEKAAISLNTVAINVKSVEESIKALSEEKEDIKAERLDIEKDALQLSTKKDQMKELLAKTEDKEKEIEKRLKELSFSIDENTYNEGTANRNLSELQIEEANAKSEVGFAKENADRIRNELERNNKELVDISKRQEELKKEEEAFIKESEEIKSKIKENDSSFSKLLEKIEATERTREEKQKENVAFLEEKDRLSKEIGRLERESIRLEATLERVESDKLQSANRIWDEYEITYHNALPLLDETLDPSEMRKELSGINNRLREIGPVNVDAIEEYANVKERYEFLTGQCEDLRQGRERLLSIIDDLNTEMRAKFEEGFSEISKEFDLVFKELFGGGTGKLELADGNDILESGIRIVAQPPGKKLTNMMQLSGGEKSLTAIAILFAILNLKPSPFCLLDEIEAALDEPNVDRFAQYLNKLTKHTQFIIITHRRGTMNSADRLYGITMQEKGISTLVSVSLIEDELD